MKYYAIGEFAEKIKVTTQTLRNWKKDVKSTPHHISDGSHRYLEQSLK